MQLMEQSFGERSFSHAELGDARRTRRLVSLADHMVHRPGSTLPEKIRDPADLKAMYRLLSCAQVTHAAIMKSHQEYMLKTVLPSRSGFTLIIHDATELEYTNRRSITNELGQIGNGFRRGYIAQNSLAVCPVTGASLGLINQVLHRRVKRKPGETQAARKKRQTRESLLWAKGNACLPSDRKYVDVCDRGADITEFLVAEAESGRTFVIRSKTDRSCWRGHEAEIDDMPQKLHALARTLPLEGTWELSVAGKTEYKSKGRTGPKELVTRKKRIAKMGVSFGAVRIRTSRAKKSPGIRCWIVRVWELNPPRGQERLEWFLITNHPVQSFEDAYEVTGWYEKRWVIEEYHKCLKTGMSIESYQFTSIDRLQPAIALTSIVAVTLLHMRDDSRREETKDRPAVDYLDPEYIQVLSAWRHGTSRLDWSVSQFVLALARLSGHQNRKGDHPPGWQKLWKGWHELHAMVVGARIGKQSKDVGKPKP